MRLQYRLLQPAAHSSDPGFDWEFKVQYNNLGRIGQVLWGSHNLSTKSEATNGTFSVRVPSHKGFEREPVFCQQGGIPRSPFTQNQYGATLGGAPIKEKLFRLSVGKVSACARGPCSRPRFRPLAERGSGLSGNFDYSDQCVSGLRTRWQFAPIRRFGQFFIHNL